MGLVEVTREVEATEKKTKRRAMEEERRALAARMESVSYTHLTLPTKA